MSPTRILLADDDEDWRHEALLLLQTRPDFKVISEASDGSEAVQKAEEQKPDLFLLEVGLAGLNGIEVARRIRKLSPATKIIFVSMDLRFDAVEVALSTGANGYVYKGRAQTELLPAIDAVLRGEQFVSSTFNGYDLNAASEEIPLSDDQNHDQDVDHSSIVLPPGVGTSNRRQAVRVGLFLAIATLFTAAVAASVSYGTFMRPAAEKSAQAQQQADQLKQQNAALTANLAQLNESIATQQREIQNLRAQIGDGKTADPKTGSSQANSAQTATSGGPTLYDSQSQQKLLADAKDEAARINEMRANDQTASLVDQQRRITDLTDRLQIASATLDMERQLAAAGQDVRELMVARELHVIDVRDTDPNGNREKAFGRVFLTEGKSLTFYAFDLNENAGNSNHSFEVWATPQAGKTSSRSLGLLQPDSAAQGRWVLKVDNPALVKEIDSVFVTSEPAAGGKQPSGQKMLYAYLGDANHP